MTTTQKILMTITISAAVGTVIYEGHRYSKLRVENESLQRQVVQMKRESDSLSNRLTAVADAQSPTEESLPNEQLNELFRLRTEVGQLRDQRNELERLLGEVRDSKPRNPNLPTEPAAPSALPADYPKTADTAAQAIFDTFARGDWEGFFTNFEVEGGRELFDQAMSDEAKSNLLDLEVVTIGQPTNSFGPNMWFVPYTIRLKDGSEKSLRLHIAQDPKTGRWILKGGF